MNAGPDPFAGGHPDGDEEHGDEEQGDGKTDFVNGNVTSHSHAIVANFEVNARCIKISEDVL